MFWCVCVCVRVRVCEEERKWKHKGSFSCLMFREGVSVLLSVSFLAGLVSASTEATAALPFQRETLEQDVLVSEQLRPKLLASWRTNKEQQPSLFSRKFVSEEVLKLWCLS